MNPDGSHYYGQHRLGESRPIHMCDICAIWLIHMCHGSFTTHSYVRHMHSVCDICFIRMRDILIHMCVIHYSFSHDSLMCVEYSNIYVTFVWCICVTYSCICVSFTCVSYVSFLCVTFSFVCASFCIWFVCVTWLIPMIVNTMDNTNSVSHALFITCDMTHSYVSRLLHKSLCVWFIRVTWIIPMTVITMYSISAILYHARISPFMYVIYIIHYAWSSHTCESIYVIHMCDMTHRDDSHYYAQPIFNESCVCHDPCRVTCYIHLLQCVLQWVLTCVLSCVLPCVLQCVWMTLFIHIQHRLDDLYLSGNQYLLDDSVHI